MNKDLDMQVEYLNALNIIMKAYVNLARIEERLATEAVESKNLADELTHRKRINTYHQHALDLKDIALATYAVLQAPQPKA